MPSPFTSDISLEFPARAGTELVTVANPDAPSTALVTYTARNDLSERETEVLAWIAEGKSDWEIGNILVISHKTVNYHVENAKRKLTAQTRLQAVVLAVRLGLVVVLASIDLANLLAFGAGAITSGLCPEPYRLDTVPDTFPAAPARHFS